LTGWDVDILTPVEFKKAITRLDATLKSVEGVTQEMVDKIIALGLIDVRDVEEVGEEPLMNEVGMTEAQAEEVVDKAIEEAKIVIKEQEIEKAAKEAARRAGTPDLLAALGGGASASASAAAVPEKLVDDAPISSFAPSSETPRVGNPDATGDAADVGKYATSVEANGRDVLTAGQASGMPEASQNSGTNEDATTENQSAAEEVSNV
ncbi:MAG: nusA, partial [Phycisphaerales bacterium]|nr:nusA [Phycisphaerales bacterium]